MVKNDKIASVLQEISQVVVGKDEVLELIMLAILVDGHVLIEDYPGLAKTLIAKSFAKALGLNFKRIQFTSDLLPSDITGSFVLNRETSQFEFRKGPIFTNILLADEINRAPPRTQSALLEAMQERQVSVEGNTYLLERPFIVIATQNPIEYEGTYPLPEAQLDRFIMKISVGYPKPEEEVEILSRRIKRMTDDFEIRAILNAKEVLQLQTDVERIYIAEDLKKYIVQIVNGTRNAPEVEVGASVRGSIAILKLARAMAYSNARDFVTPDDIKRVAVPALRHRLILRTEYWLRGIKPDQIIERILNQVPVPKL
ncbi:MAG TPA: MoxR family ATPase [Geobacterales bacterium]|nr:MoxR family ATPase [Geobacterales bacterium]